MKDCLVTQPDNTHGHIGLGVERNPGWDLDNLLARFNKLSDDFEDYKKTTDAKIEQYKKELADAAGVGMGSNCSNITSTVKNDYIKKGYYEVTRNGHIFVRSWNIGNKKWAPPGKYVYLNAPWAIPGEDIEVMRNYFNEWTHTPKAHIIRDEWISGNEDQKNKQLMDIRIYEDYKRWEGKGLKSYTVKRFKDWTETSSTTDFNRFQVTANYDDHYRYTIFYNGGSTVGSQDNCSIVSVKKGDLITLWNTYNRFGEYGFDDISLILRYA